MQYFISFLEGIITFISPCLLPMLPIYVSYFAGGETENAKGKTLKNALGFVAGFTTVFVLMGALAGTVGGFLSKYQTAVNIVSGLIVVFFGLNYLGVFKLNIFKGLKNPLAGKQLGFFSSALFGIVFSVGWTPCVGAFLGSALMLASQQGQTLTGIIMLLCYSLGLGIPFVASAVLIDKLKSAFTFIKKNYKTINIICGILLIAVGALMMTGLLGRLLAVLS
ncbi:MAG: cytochrome c biogenesis protein CcdA [Clostridia bacterium]|nr:cytochrome c biogenesis protein CcdA [Clostridia bacterium]